MTPSQCTCPRSRACSHRFILEGLGVEEEMGLTDPICRKVLASTSACATISTTEITPTDDTSDTTHGYQYRSGR
uniref:SWIM-type domain-containing protein n=1 Tax=Panagrellus redivivus TaxID=6233 RepID=A0A7E4VRN9_PANRE